MGLPHPPLFVPISRDSGGMRTPACHHSLRKVHCAGYTGVSRSPKVSLAPSTSLAVSPGLIFRGSVCGPARTESLCREGLCPPGCTSLESRHHYSLCLLSLPACLHSSVGPNLFSQSEPSVLQLEGRFLWVGLDTRESWVPCGLLGVCQVPQGTTVGSGLSDLCSP